mgnify:CR=1 FL=1
MRSIQRICTTLAAAFVLAACASTGDRPASNTCNNCGEITNIDQRTARSDEARGQSIGRSLGSVDRTLSMPAVRTLDVDRLSRQLGAGRSLDMVDLQSALPRLVRVYAVNVDMDNGPDQQVIVESVAGLRIGERVRVVGDRLLPAP